MARKIFFVSDWGKLTESGLYNPHQAQRYRGRHPGTTLTRPETTRRYPWEADAVEEEAHTPEGVFHASLEALLVRASSTGMRNPPPPSFGVPHGANLKIRCR